uniref:Uncharacterized protein n=1 Tax=uncultured organism TaxID=155900 RepID=A0A385FVR3_9ZZZZ|nr:hypothetical protein TRI3_00006 [uncultured organism]
MPSFIVEFWSSIFGILAKVSVFTLVRKLFPSAITARFVDFWVLSHLVLSMVAVVVAVYSPSGLTHQCLYFEQPHTFEQILFIQTAEPALVGHA